MTKNNNINNLFIKLRHHDGAIWVEDNRISLNVPEQFQNQEIFGFIKENKSQLIQILTENQVFSEEKFIETEILRDSNSSHYPLSHGQERLWFIEQYEQGTNAYLIPAVYELDKDTDIEGIKYALRQIVSRHEILRSTIEQGEAQEHGVQRVHDEPLIIEEIILNDRQDYKSMISADISRPFNLSIEYAIRAKFYTIVSTEPLSGNPLTRTLLLINAHHIASDGWSIDIFRKELVAYYEAYIANNANFRLPALEIQYRDYAVWQRAYLSGSVLESQLTYWKDKLSGYQPLELPTDYTRPAEIDYSGSSQLFTVDKQISDSLGALARRYGVTLHSVLLSSINILLSKYTGQDDIITGSPIANRHHRQTEGLIGFFVNTLANRTRLSKNQSFDDLVQQVHQEQIQAQLHQDLPFEKLIDELGVERDRSRHPVFQVMFSVQSFGGAHETPAKSKQYLRPFRVTDFYKVERFDLSIFIDDSGQELKGEISYATALFNQGTIERFIEHYRYLLAQLTAAPEQPYSKFSLLGPAEYDQVINKWNAANQGYPNDKTIHRLFQEQAGKTPDNIALVYADRQMTYRELNEQGNRLARFIRKQYEHRTKQPMPADALIALYLDRSLEMVIGILAVLKAGGAYVPMDTAYPQERIDYLVADSGAELVLCQRPVGGNNSVQLPRDKVIYIDIAEDLSRDGDISDLPQHSTAAELAYVIYTSGTTGKPKGVLQTHGNVMRLFTCTDHQFCFKADDVWTLFHSYVFDFTVWELWGSLFYGGKLIITSREQTKDMVSFYDLCRKHKVTVLNQTPSSFYNFADIASHADQPDLALRYIIFGGEALNVKQLRPWWSFQARHNLTTKLINMYGITETTVHVTYKELTAGETAQSNIGKPLADLQAYVLDAYNTPVPVGVTGELYIGGAGLARGYLNRPELTESRFIANPFATEADKARGYIRLYKTGDLVRWLPDGSLEYMGRNDDQVKIRGHRIELGEIEHAFMQIGGIKQSCVLARERKTVTGNNKYLVAYYVPDNNDVALTQTVIRDRLSQLLPEYMVPAAFVEIKSFPLTINGKLDKEALPEPELRSSPEEYISPATETEITLCGIWQEVLGLDRVGNSDDFFRIGGDSILSIQVSGRIRQAGFNCQVKDIFECRTVARLAEHLGQKKSALPIKSEQGILSGELDFLSVQRWFIEKAEQGTFAKPNHYNQSFLVRVPALDPGKLESAIGALAAHHDALRMQYVIKDAAQTSTATGLGQWNQFYQLSIALPELKTLDVSNHSEAEIQDILTDWQSGLNLEHGTLFQPGYLYGYEDGSARIYFALHHMIVDTVSWHILTEDIKTLYEERALPPKGSSYRQWVAAVNNYTQQYPEEASWWEKQLDGMPDYRVDCDAKPSTEIVEFDGTLTKSLLQNVSDAYHTEINDLLLTALAYALKDINQNNIQCITLEGHGREDIDPTIDTSRTVGWFTSMFPVRLELQNHIGESIRSVKDGLRNVPNKGIGFGAFATEKETRYGQNALIPISFNYLGQFDTPEGGWQIAAEGSGSSIHPGNNDQNLVNINGLVSDGRLVFSIATRLGGDTTKQLGDSFKMHLSKIIDHCKEKLEQAGSSYTPGDFYQVAHEGDLAKLPLLKNSLKMHEPFLMTEIQKAYLLGRLDSFEIGGVSNHIYHEFKFSASIDIPKLEKVINLLIEAYPELRTVFDIETLTQRYLDASRLKPYRINVNSYSYGYSEDRLTTIRGALSHHIYDPYQFPLFTFHISRFSDCDILHISIDLILLDAESRQKFFTELTNLYHEDSPDLKPARLNFKDYQDYISFLKYSKWYEKDKNYWNNKLGNLPLRPGLLLKNDPKTISKPKFDMSVKFVEEAVWTKFKNKSSDQGISASAALLSLFGYVLSRYATTKDFLITLTVFNRYSVHPDVNSIWGDFTSTNLFGYKNATGSINEKLSLMHNELWNDLSHGLFNGLEVLRQLQSMHKLDPYQAVSPIVFTGRVGGNGDQPQENNIDQYFLDESEEKSSRVWMAQTSQAWIDLQAIEMGNKFCSGWMYVEQLFDKEFIEKLNADYCDLITYLAEADWESPMPELALSANDQSVIESCNNHYQAPVTETMVDICLSGIDQHQKSIAVIDTKGVYSYEQTGINSFNIAGYLHDHELSKPNQLIGILSEKGYDQVVSALGIMQSGAAYLPLHVEWPIGRVDEVLEEGLVKTVLASKSQFTGCIKGSSIETKYKWLIVGDIIEYQPQITAAKLPKPGLDDIAYVIFTSGSTGKPKGVTIAHKGAVNTIAAVNTRFGISKADKVLALSELSFDLSVYDIFGLLSAGGTIVFPDQEKTKEPGHWYELISRHGITVWDTVPQLMQLLADYVSAVDGTLTTLKTVLLSGDWIPVKLPGRIKELNPAVTVMSLGGATEGSIWSVWYAIEEVDPAWGSIPYGLAMPNQKMYVLNEFGEHCPVGVSGEIHIGGAGVALGYWNDRQKSDASFIEHVSLGRLYKTGDLGKWHRAGYMEFEGRKDNQVKLNGYRVELDEISSKLTNIAGIDKSLVTIQDNQLVAYLVADKLKENGQETDKVAFKFEQKGIRKDLEPGYTLSGLNPDEKQYRLRKSYRQFESGLSLSKAEINALVAGNPAPHINGHGLNGRNGTAVHGISWIAALKDLLKPLSAIQLKDKVLPKYLYPSGGSTYAIQCYVDLAEDLDQGKLKQGSYYYEPVSHYLASVEKQPSFSHGNGRPSSPIKLRFKLYKPAIEPLYGEMALKLAWLEMGHILALIEQQWAGLHLNGQLTVIDKEEGDYHRLIEVPIGHGETKPLYPGNGKPEIDYLSKDSQGFGDSDGHQYNLSGLDLFTKISEFGQLLESASGLVLFKGSDDPQSLVGSGYQAQLLTDKLYQKGIGSCVLGFAPYENINYSIAIGQITNPQKAEPESQAKKVSAEAAIKQHLGQYLPAYMLPDHYISLNELPLTANGKIDYKQLPKAEITREEYVPPATESERKICAIWQEVLGVERVGITDDFFMIGGNSILAIQVSHHMSLALGCEVKVADVFRFKSVYKILNSSQPDDEKYFSMVKPYNFDYDSDLADLIFIHPGNAGSEVYQNLAEILKTKYNCVGVDNYNIHNKTKIGSLNELATHYLAEYETMYTLREPVNLLGWSLGGEIALEMAVILETREYKNINVVLLDTILADETTRNLRKHVTREESIAYLVQLKDLMITGELEQGYFEKVVSAIDAEKELADSSISKRLQYSNVVLFKAAREDTRIDTDNYKLLYQHSKRLTANNVDLAADNVEIINLDCNHLNILETNCSNIASYLLNVNSSVIF